MLRNYLISAFRHLTRQRGLLVVNGFGLAVGVGCCLLIALFIRSERAVNAFFPALDQLYRLDSEWADPSMGLPFTAPAAAGPALAEALPEVAGQVRLYGMVNGVRVGDEAFRAEVLMADASFFDLFGLPLLHGDPATALRQPRTVVLTADLARTYFGTDEVLGRTVLLETWQNGWQPYTVTGVRQKLPYNSVTYYGTEDGYSLLISPHAWDYFPEDAWTSWDSRYIMQFLLLAPRVSAAALQQKMAGFVEAQGPETYHSKLTFRLNPLRNLHLTDHGGRGLRVVRLLALVAGLILLIACINFANLATAGSLARVREVGVRKALGAHRGQLAWQFLGEAVLTSVLATSLGAAGAALTLRPFFAMLGKDLVLTHPWDGPMLAFLAAVALGVGLLAGAYPALHLASFHAAKALKGLLRFSTGMQRLRQGLVVVQFVAAVVLLVGVTAVSRQLAFVFDADLGFDTENVLVLDTVPRAFTDAGVEAVKTAREQFLRIPGVTAASVGWGPALGGFGARHPLRRPEQAVSEALNAAAFVVDENFLATFGIELLAGRFFSGGRGGEGEGVVLNETAARALGWTEPAAAVAQPLVYYDTTLAVDGVVADHHFESLHEPVRPQVFFSVEALPQYRVISLRLATNDVQETMAAVRAVWDEVFPGAAFGYRFLDEDVAQAYHAERQVRRIITMAAGLALLIACLGMLGLASLSVVQRTKEVGVRKVLGASSTQVAFLLARDFTRPVLVALLLALPAGYVLVQRWLDDFAYRAEMPWMLFVFTGVAAWLVAFLTVGFLALRAAHTDPVEALRYE